MHEYPSSSTNKYQYDVKKVTADTKILIHKATVKAVKFLHSVFASQYEKVLN